MRLGYRLLRRVFLIVAGPVFRLRIEGAERFPDTGAAIIVARHRSWLDPPLIAGACRRSVEFLILDSVYHKRWARWFYRWMRAIPVSTDGSASLRALREALKRLKSGGVIGIFPEGRVFSDQQPGEFRPGVALLALRSSARIVPIKISGSSRAWPRGRAWPRAATVRVHVGQPIDPESPEEGTRGRESAEELMERIARALE
jgi:1-acyl-sn-glycerol-3-phosphate acyltransferase